MSTLIEVGRCGGSSVPESGCADLQEQDFHFLHRNVPALRRTGINTMGIRQQYYPDGGWGWIICSMAFIMHILTSGIQLSYGFTLFYTLQHINNANGKGNLDGLLCYIILV